MPNFKQRWAHSNFFILLFIVREQPISFVFFNRSKNYYFILSEVVVHFPSISFVFSLNDRSVKSFV